MFTRINWLEGAQLGWKALNLVWMSTVCNSSVAHTSMANGPNPSSQSLPLAIYKTIQAIGSTRLYLSRIQLDRPAWIHGSTFLRRIQALDLYLERKNVPCNCEHTQNRCLSPGFLNSSQSHTLRVGCRFSRRAGVGVHALLAVRVGCRFSRLRA